MTTTPSTASRLQYLVQEAVASDSFDSFRTDATRATAEQCMRRLRSLPPTAVEQVAASVAAAPRPKIVLPG